jgi:Zn-dependent peptidase ImmA (M78 family)
MDWDSKPANAAAYWVAYVLSAFQEEEEHDGDPDRQGTIVLARCDRSEGGALLYVEQLDEYVGADEHARLAAQRVAVVHEIGHLVANSDDELVTRSPDEPYRYTEIYLNLIRSNAKPAG